MNTVPEDSFGHCDALRMCEGFLFSQLLQSQISRCSFSGGPCGGMSFNTRTHTHKNVNIIIRCRCTFVFLRDKHADGSHNKRGEYSFGGPAVLQRSKSTCDPHVLNSFAKTVLTTSRIYLPFTYYNIRTPLTNESYGGRFIY